MNTTQPNLILDVAPPRHVNRWQLFPGAEETADADLHEHETTSRTETTTAVPPHHEPDTAQEDAALMQAIADRDPAALAKLYDRYSGILKALVIRVIHDEAEADDLLQEIFMQIWKQARN